MRGSKRVAVIFAAVLLLSFGAALFYQSSGQTLLANAVAPTQTAEKMPQQAAEDEPLPVLHSTSHALPHSFGEGAPLVVSANEAFSHIYIEWERPARPWTLQLGEGSMACGGEGFLHEYVQLEAPQTQVEIRAEGEDAVILSLHLFAAGALPAWVQRWQPPCSKADLLVLPTHADDEHLYFGGVLPTYAGQRGLRVQVAYFTHHWQDSRRMHELLDGLWAVGVTAYPVFSNFADQYAASLPKARQLYGEQQALEYQVMLLRRFKPSVVVGHDIDGEYGHGVHKLNAITLLQAAKHSNQASAFPESAAAYGLWEVPKIYLHLYPQNIVTMNWDTPLERFGGKTAFEMAQQGFAMHKSQQDKFNVQQTGPYSCRKFGLAHTTVGWDTEKQDLFENIAL